MKRTTYMDMPVYTAYKKDTDREYLDGSNYSYILKFDRDYVLPDVFWSITIYRLAGHTMADDPIRRYLINSPMYSNMIKDEDGGMTIYIQRNSPGIEKENNWLPPPSDLFFIVVRIYWPKEQVIRADLRVPTIKKQSNVVKQLNVMDKKIPNFLLWQ